MDEQIGGMDQWMNRYMQEGWINGWIDRRDGPMDGSIEEGWINGWIDRGGMDQWIEEDGSMDR